MAIEQDTGLGLGVAAAHHSHVVNQKLADKRYH